MEKKKIHFNAEVEEEYEDAAGEDARHASSGENAHTGQRKMCDMTTGRNMSVLCDLKTRPTSPFLSFAPLSPSPPAYRQPADSSPGSGGPGQ